MNEYEIATAMVLPYLYEKVGWPKELISAYGRVPVQIGTNTVWADYVCYITQNSRTIPWLLIEVKQKGVPLEQAVPQAESYSLILGTPFFCVTDGEAYKFFVTGSSQGKSVPLQGYPPIPENEYLDTQIDRISFPPIIDSLIDLFLFGLKEEAEFFKDTKDHDVAVKQLKQNVFNKLDSITPQELKNQFDNYMMMKIPNRNRLFEQIDNDFEKVKNVLKLILDIPLNTIGNLQKLLDKSEPVSLKGGGIFFITQLLAGAHPNEYVVLEENISKALRYLGITDIMVKNDTANGYIYVNEICKKLYRDKLEHRLTDYGFGLAAVHNFLWHYYVNYRVSNKWLSKNI